MLRVGILVWILAATVLAGCFVIIVLVVPQLEIKAMAYIPVAAILGAVVAVIPSWMIAKAIISRAHV